MIRKVKIKPCEEEGVPLRDEVNMKVFAAFFLAADGLRFANIISPTGKDVWRILIDKWGVGWKKLYTTGWRVAEMRLIGTVEWFDTKNRLGFHTVPDRDPVSYWEDGTKEEL
ncbi:MAG: hypothetical protein KGJ13_07495 [Patescibacteria group bacterium]|nr:hypothetical protein [Patescibacteria group bacterium]